jgi:hypothetical protein
MILNIYNFVIRLRPPVTRSVWVIEKRGETRLREPLATIPGRCGKGATTWPQKGIIIETLYRIKHVDDYIYGRPD